MLKPILLVEDNPNDLELTLVALETSQLANEVIIVRDGAEALDYLFRRNAHAERLPGNPAIILLDLKLPKIDGLGFANLTPSSLQGPKVWLMISRRHLQRCLACMSSARSYGGDSRRDGSEC